MRVAPPRQVTSGHSPKPRSERTAKLRAASAKVRASDHGFPDPTTPTADHRESTRGDRGDNLKEGRRGPGPFFSLLLIRFPAAAGYRFSAPPPAAAPKVESPPHLVREARRISIPEGSQLREKLVIETVS